MSGFFPASSVASKAPSSTLPQCGACGLSKRCESPKLEVAGDGNRKILIVVSAPSSLEDAAGRWTPEHKTYRRLRETLSAAGVDIEEDCWITGALICHEADRGRAKNASQRIAFCQPNIAKTIKRLRPHVIIPVGQEAVSSVIGHSWKDNPGGVERWVGWSIPCQKLNAWICPVYSPDYVDNAKNPVVELMFSRHIAKAVKHDARPWQSVPDWSADVETIMGPKAATAAIRDIYKRAKRNHPNCYVTIDYEGNCLKPDSNTWELATCSLTYGEGGEPLRTIAYPWHGDAIDATARILFSPIPKIAANMKFEERWTKAFFKRKAKNWKWDTMLAAHLLDTRKGTKGLSFLSYVHFGQPLYDEHISPFLHTSDASGLNRINEIELTSLLLYNGLDTLLEYRLAMLQMGQLGFLNEDD